MKRTLLFFILTVFFVNLSVVEAKEAKDAQGIAYYKAGFPQVAKPLLLKEYNMDSLTRSESCFYLGNIYFGEQKPDSAAIFFKRGLSGKENVLNTIGLAMLKIKSDQKSADQEIQNVLNLKSSKKNQDYFIAAANAYLVNGLIDQATIYLEKAKTIKPKYALTAVLAGDIELAKKDVGNACSNYEMAILYDENCKEAYVKYARAYRDVNKALAIDMLNKLKAKEPSFLLTDKELADIYYVTNEFDKAADLYGSYMKSGNISSADLLRYAMTLFFNHEFAKSLEIANAGHLKSPRNPAFNRLVMYNNTDLKQYDEAIKSADLLFNQSDKPDYNYLDYRYYGQALRETKKFDLAIIEYKKAIEMDSSKIDLWKDISDMYNDNSDYKNAIANYLTYEHLLAADKQTADVSYELGRLYYSLGNSAKDSALVKKGALLKADSVFTKVVTLDPTNYRGYIWRARTNFSMDPETLQGLAKPFYEQTIPIVELKKDPRYNPVIVECCRYLGYYFYLKKDFTESKMYWNKILAIDPANEMAKNAIDGIDKSLKGKK